MSKASYVSLETTIPPELDRALAQMVEVTGLSKATLVRCCIAAYLDVMDVVHENVSKRLTPTKTGGRGLATHRKEPKK